MLRFSCSLFNSCTLPDRKIQGGISLHRGKFCTNALCVRAFFVPKTGGSSVRQPCRRQKGGKHTKKETIELKSLVRLAGCEKYHRLSQLNLLDAGSKRKKLFNRAVKYLVTDLIQEGKRINEGDILPKLEAFFRQEYRTEDFACAKECEAEREADYRKLERFVAFLAKNGQKPVQKNIQQDIRYPVSVNGHSFSQVRCRIDLVLEDGRGSKEAVIISPDRPAYNSRARLAAKKPENSPELLSVQCALKSSGIVCGKSSIYYMGGKNDANGAYPDFTPTDNTVSISNDVLSRTDISSLMELLAKLLSSLPKKECERCRFAGICCLETKDGSNAGSMDCGDRLNGAGDKPVPPSVKLTEKQEIIRDFRDGVMRVIAIPGSGKTYSLVQRLVSLIQQGVPPEKILFVTFANKAAREIQKRVSAHVCSEKKPEVTTFNSLGMKILRENEDVVGKVTLATKIRVTELILELLSDERTGEIAGCSYENMLGEHGIAGRLRSAIADINKNGKDLFLAKQQKDNSKLDYAGILRFYDVYMEEAGKRNLITFDEQVSKAVELLRCSPEIKKHYGLKWDYIMADEYQDVSKADAELLYMLADAGKGNLMCVGDMDQAIYAFREKDCGKQLYSLPVKYPGCRTVFMNDNFRSAEKILKASSLLIANNPGRMECEINAHKPEGSRPIFKGRYKMEQLPGIIRQLTLKGYCPGDIGILARYNKTLFHASDILDAQGMPSQSPKTYLRENPFFLMVYDLLNLYYNGFSDSRTDSSFYRIYLSCHAEGLLYKREGMKHQTLYDSLAASGDIYPVNFDSIAACLPYQCDNPDSGAYMAVMRKIFHAMYEIKYGGHAPDKALGKIAEILYEGRIPPAADDIIRIIYEGKIKTFHELFTCMEQMIAYSDDKKAEWTIRSDRLNLLTAHESKGLEFPVVVILNCEEFIRDDDERKLFYVAMTRAQKELIMVETDLKQFEMKNELAGYITAC